MPPDALTVMLPLAEPQVAWLELALALKAEAGSVMVWLAVAVQPLASVTVTLYDPADRPAMFWLVAPFDHKYVSAPVPPDTVKVIVPLPPPLQLTLVEEPMLALKLEPGWVMV